MKNKIISAFVFVFLFVAYAWAAEPVLKRTITGIDDVVSARAGAWRVKSDGLNRNGSHSGTATITFTPGSATDAGSVTGFNLPSGSTENPATVDIVGWAWDATTSTNQPYVIDSLTVLSAGQDYACTNCYGFIGVYVNSMSAQGTDTPVMLVHAVE